MLKRFLLLLACLATLGAASAVEVNDTIAAVENGYISANNTAQSLKSSSSGKWNMEVKNYVQYSRWAYINLPLEKIIADPTSVKLGLYLATDTSDDLGEGVDMNVYACKYAYDGSITWNTKVEPTSDNEVLLGAMNFTNEMKGTLTYMDITEYVKELKQAGESYLVLRLNVAESQNLTLRFRQVNNGNTGQYYPRLIQTYDNGSSSVNTVEKDETIIYPTLATDCIHVSGTDKVEIYNTVGMLVYRGIAENGTISINGWAPGIYIAKIQNHTTRFIKK